MIAFPIPYPGQAPGDDMARAVSLLRLVTLVLTETGQRGLDGQDVTDLSIAVAQAQDLLAPIQRYLDDIDSDRTAYLLARRQDVLEKSGGAA